ncbi:type II toxin-antitoxin system RelE/ParE family toxin [Novosphingobium sp. B 225]|uniref:type II toxin-antitoxin system RelE/ParE family toxin n=1 Tax=Novosphingobium sp. B 225 TaxID=1961849 RepID=UPI00159626A4|nr:type II toxin-antitoxin system RelE/ParE family toxin [Novosphingobium sp. B 225]
MTGKPRIRIYKNRWFAKFASREGISDATLVAAIDHANRGLIDADLGGGLIKQRVAREGGGKSGGYRTLVFFRHEELAIFAFGFAKSDKANLSAAELKVYKQAAKFVLALTQAQIDTEVREERMFEVNDDAQDL